VHGEELFGLALARAALLAPESPSAPRRDHRSGFTGANQERLAGGTARGSCGGGFDSTAAQAKSSYRRSPEAVLRSPNLGLRAARALQR
jgi:hypothetical protein